MMPTTYPILEAIRARDAQMISQLIQDGVRLDVKDSNAHGIWHLLADCPDASLMPLFDPVFPYTEPQEDAMFGGSTPFLRAVHNGEITVINAFLERGANPAQQDRDYYNAWHYVALSDHPHVIPLLDVVFPCADPDVVGADTPLYLAFEREHLEVSLALVKRGGNLNLVNDRGFSALELLPHLAGQRHSAEARFLCEVIRHSHHPFPVEQIFASRCPEVIYAWLQKTYPDETTVQVLAATDMLAGIPSAEWPALIERMLPKQKSSASESLHHAG